LSEKVTIYTDGSASPNPGPGGWAAVLMYGDVKKEISGSERHTTNNRMELTAAVEALATLKRPCEIEFFTDSQYMRNGITKWIHGWMKNGWKTAAKKPVENQELWIKLYALTQTHTIDWKWVKGHADNELNERVDQLANEARKNKIGLKTED
jgi:ribonuclease HI